jgi:hypothetical protein
MAEIQRGNTSRAVQRLMDQVGNRVVPESTAVVIVSGRPIGVTFTRVSDRHEVAYGRAGVLVPGGERRIHFLGWGQLSREPERIEQALLSRKPLLYVAGESEASRWVSDNLLPYQSPK